VKLLAAVLLLAALPSAANAGGPAPTFVETNTLGYTAAEYTDLGLASATTPLRLVLGLTPRNAPQIGVLLARMSTPGDPLAGTSLSPAQTTAMFGQTPAAVQSVVSYLTTSGFTNVSASADRLLVSATGTVALADAAFATQIDAVRIAGQTTFANIEPAYVPSALGGIVSAVEGLSGVTMHSERRTPATAGCTLVAVVGRCVAGTLGWTALRSFYDTPGTAPGTKTTLAIVAAGSVGALAGDLARADAAGGVAAVPVTTVTVGRASSDVSLLPEWDLDAQSAVGIAGGASRLVVYAANSLGEADVTAALGRFESDATATAASASFGICEDVAATDGSMAVDDTLLALAALHGQTLFAATGDKLDACPAQEYPASSPYALAVGATTVLAPATGAVQTGEVAWTLTAGGPSALERGPFWQGGVAPALAARAGLRAVPDLALDGDPNTAITAIVNGGQQRLGGTSLAASLALGIWARLESAHGNALGFAAPRLYREYADLLTAADAMPPAGAIEQNIGGFRDLLVGVSGLPATPEDDFATGLGSLDARLQGVDILR
jgi:subtilase family serine protease